MGIIASFIEKFKKDKNKGDNVFSKTNSFAEKLKRILTSHRTVDEELFVEIEELLITSDIGINVSSVLVEELRKRVKSKNINTTELVVEELISAIKDFYTSRNITFSLNVDNSKTNVVLVVGTNGSGKTTSIAKLAYYFRERNHKVRVIAADTFRAGAVKQIEIWCERLGVSCTSPTKNNQDPSSVIYKGLEDGKNEGASIIICDTAGRSQVNKNLMDELSKIKKVINKVLGESPAEVLLTIDSTAGQNGLSQAKHFFDSVNVTGIILTKLDGLSKGGIILPIISSFNIPVKFIGFGETYYDISEFNIDSYLYNLIKPLIEGEQKIRGFGYG